jgi:glycosyltransferase involved in cell wall biosynthesis
VLSDVDIVVFPSAGTSEGMPGVLIEAGMAGVPVVATDVPGASTIVADGETGFIVGVDDHDGLTKSLHRLLIDSGLRKSMGTAARVRCTTLFALESSVERWQHLLAPLIDGRPQPRGNVA